MCEHPDPATAQNLHDICEADGPRLEELGSLYGGGYPPSLADIRRHLACSVWPAGAASPPGALAARVGRLEAQVLAWHEEAERLLVDAKKDPVHRGLALDRGVKVIAAAKQVLELAGKLSGELRDGAAVMVDQRTQVVALVASPEWGSLRARLVEALGPYPEARAAVLRALSGGEEQVVPALPAGGGT